MIDEQQKNLGEEALEQGTIGAVLIIIGIVAFFALGVQPWSLLPKFIIWCLTLCLFYTTFFCPFASKKWMQNAALFPIAIFFVAVLWWCVKLLTAR